MSIDKNTNRIGEIIDCLFSVSFVPDGNTKALDKLCQLYEIDRVRCYARFPNSDIFVNINDDRFGKVPEYNADENGFDFNKSLYQGEIYSTKTMIAIMNENPIIYTKDISGYEEYLQEIGYTSNEEEVAEVFVGGMKSRSTGIMGYMVFEQFKGSAPWSDETKADIRRILKIMLTRIENDETAKQLKQEESKSDTDHLTGLPVLRKFRSIVRHLLDSDDFYAFLAMDIDKFKYINDIWSFSTGNSILKEVGSLLEEFIREDEVASRMVDDKFGVLLKFTSEADLNARLELLDVKLTELQHKHFTDIKITATGGVYKVYEMVNFNLMLDKANVARRTGKGSYKNIFVVYDKSLESISDREKNMEKRIQSAMECGEFVPFFQPKFNLMTNEICGVEALARWVTDERMIPPYEFIPLFETNGFITELDFVIYEKSMEFMRYCLDNNYPVYPTSLNVSRWHINDEDFFGRFENLVDKYNIPREFLELEITESIFEEDKSILIQFISEIRRRGISVAIDDFGAAYSSLNLLKDVDVDIIKFDKAFIDNIANDNQQDDIKKDKIVIENMVNMVNDLGVKTIFEGIELGEQIEFLKSTGCQLGQGYIFSKPLSLEMFEDKFLKKVSV